jgi:hypothetical protein
MTETESHEKLKAVERTDQGKEEEEEEDNILTRLSQRNG